MGQDPTRGLLRDPNLYVLFAITSMVVLGVSSISPAFPRIQEALDLTPQQVGLLVTAFTLPGVFLTPFLGVAGDRLGRRAVLVPGLVLFALAGGACALVDDFALLLGLRVLQGMGAAPLGALNLALVGDLYAGPRRGAAVAYNQTALAMAVSVLPAVGGALALLSWNAPFALPLLALPVAAAVQWGLALPPRPPGALPLRAYLGGLARSLRDRRIVTVFGVSLATFVLLYGIIITYLPILMDERFGASPLLIGLVTASNAAASGVSAAWLGRRHPGARPVVPVVAGFALYALSALLFPRMPSAAWLFLPAVIFGIGQGLNLPAALTLLTEVVAPDQRAGLLALNGTVLRLGQTLAPLLLGVAYGLGGLEAAYGGAAVFAVLVALVVAVLLGNRRA